MEIIPFEFDEKEIRTVVVDDQPWFVAKDIAVALGYSNTNDAILKHYHGVVKRYPIINSKGVAFHHPLCKKYRRIP